MVYRGSEPLLMKVGFSSRAVSLGYTMEEIQRFL
jgi:hypothetical protein